MGTALPLALMLGACAALAPACGGSSTDGDRGGQADAGLAGASGDGAAGASGDAGTGGSAGGGGTLPDAGTDAGPDFLDEYAAAIVEAHCATVGPCCAAHGLSDGACASTYGDLIRAAFADLRTMDGVELHPEKLAACIQELDAYLDVLRTCDRLALGEFQPECGLVVGTVALGSACTDDEQCARSAGRVVECTGSVCQPSGRGQDGDACGSTCPLRGACIGTGSASAVSCHHDDGLYCAEGTCRPLVPAGLGGCGRNDLACEPGHRCVQDECVALRADGSPCADHEECFTGHCRTGSCAPVLGAGEPCGYDEECPAFCGAGRCVSSDQVYWSFVGCE